MASITYVFLIAAFCIAGSMQTPYQPCKNLPAPKGLTIQNCSKLPCSLKRGTTVEAKVDFAVLDDTKTLTPKVDVQVGLIHIPYELPEQNACNSLVNGECPLDKGEVVTYGLKMPIEPFYPYISLTIQLSLVDDKGNSQACVRIPAQVVS